MCSTTESTLTKCLSKTGYPSSTSTGACRTGCASSTKSCRGVSRISQSFILSRAGRTVQSGIIAINLTISDVSG